MSSLKSRVFNSVITVREKIRGLGRTRIRIPHKGIINLYTSAMRRRCPSQAIVPRRHRRNATTGKRSMHPTTMQRP